MASPIDVLENEHSLVRQGLSVLERIAGHADTGMPFPAADTAILLRFFNEFVEAVHHCKEARHLLPAVASRAGDATVEAAGILIIEHDETRELLHSLMMFWEPVDDLTPAERQGFAETARTYARRMQRHMEIEEGSLFRAARRLIPPDDLLALDASFGHVDERSSSARWRAKLVDLRSRWS